jgi:DNA-binding transcriptional MocR family regulator
MAGGRWRLCRAWFPAEAPGPHLRLSFAGARAEWVEEAVRVLADVIGAVCL